MKWLVYMVMAIGVLVASPGCRKDGKQSDKDDRQSEETDEQFGRYEATCEFTIDMRRPQEKSDFAEIVFNTRKSGWRSKEIFTEIVRIYRGWRLISKVTDKELATTLAKSKLELVPRSRLVRITVRSDSPELAADLANAYVEAIEKYTDEENKKRCDKAVAEIYQQVEKQKRADDVLAARLLTYRMENKIDALQAMQASLNQKLQTITADMPEYETLNKKLAEVSKKIAQADAGLKQLDSEKKVSSEIYQNLLQKENEARIAAEQNNEIICVGRRAQIPTEPVGR